ncbi:MAG: hypothetical protein KC492_09480, partial [Myxococcales bacterium]|nr:hypothetical protein [Myxococcales bacterium]
MRHVLVGAGAVGISYAWYLAQAGHEVAFLVKEKHADALRAGTNVYFPKKKGVREPVRFEGYEVLTSPEQLREKGCDAAWLCMSATAMRGPWLEPFLAELGSDATLVSLTPGAEDFAYLAERFDPARIVTGLITLVAWQTPLPKEAEHPPGIAIWFPPRAKLPLFGPEARTRPLVDALNGGGKTVARFAGASAEDGGSVASAILMSHVVALEGVGWSFAALRKSPLKRLAARSSREGMAVLAALKGNKAPFGRKFVRTWSVGTVMRLAACQAPMDFEVYLEYHFMKVRDQTQFSMGELVRNGRDRGLPVENIEKLRDTVFSA